MNQPNYSHVKAGGHGSRQATRKPGCSELHIKRVGCVLEPVAAERGTTTRTTSIQFARRYRVWAIYARVNGNETRVRQFSFKQLADATAFVKGENLRNPRAFARVQAETVAG